MNMAENHRNAAPQRKRTLLIGFCNIPCQLGVIFLDIKYRKNMVIREWCKHCGPCPTLAINLEYTCWISCDFNVVYI
jgi:hypothetical protein